MKDGVLFETEWFFELCEPIKIVVLESGQIFVDGKLVEPLEKTRAQLFADSRSAWIDES